MENHAPGKTTTPATGNGRRIGRILVNLERTGESANHTA
jgi:hypothetical protein